jgi:hypothetical protein
LSAVRAPQPSAISAHDPRAEAQAVAGPPHDPRVLEPAPPAVAAPPWWADDPVDPANGRLGGPVLSPVRGRGDLTWSQWARAAPDRRDWLRDRWLGAYRRLSSPPPGYTRTRLALHRLAVYVLSPARQRASAGKMALRYTRGGFGTPFFGADEQARVAGTRLIRQRGAHAWQVPLTTLADAAAFVLDGPPDTAWAAGFDVPEPGAPAAPLDVDPAAAAWFGDWYGFAWSVLEELRADAGSAAASRVQLWPEHFDAAFECLSDSRRAGYGLSPGDATHMEPYAYVSLWAPQAVPASPLFDADTFAGAVLPLSAIVAAGDQRAAVLAFFRRRREYLSEV